MRNPAAQRAFRPTVQKADPDSDPVITLAVSGGALGARN